MGLCSSQDWSSCKSFRLNRELCSRIRKFFKSSKSLKPRLWWELKLRCMEEMVGLWLQMETMRILAWTKRRECRLGFSMDSKEGYNPEIRAVRCSMIRSIWTGMRWDRCLWLKLNSSKVLCDRELRYKERFLAVLIQLATSISTTLNRAHRCSNRTSGDKLASTHLS